MATEREEKLLVVQKLGFVVVAFVRHLDKI